MSDEKNCPQSFTNGEAPWQIALRPVFYQDHKLAWFQLKLDQYRKKSSNIDFDAASQIQKFDFESRYFWYFLFFNEFWWNSQKEVVKMAVNSWKGIH